MCCVCEWGLYNVVVTSCCSPVLRLCSFVLCVPLSQGQYGESTHFLVLDFAYFSKNMRYLKITISRNWFFLEKMRIFFLGVWLKLENKPKNIFLSFGGKNLLLFSERDLHCLCGVMDTRAISNYF